jgi:outer membrane beta-barrel protein
VHKWAFNSAFYLLAGVGGTQFADDNMFTVHFGGGYRLLLTDWLAWHIDARDYLYRTSIFGKKERVSNLEYRTGITVFF